MGCAISLFKTRKLKYNYSQSLKRFIFEKKINQNSLKQIVLDSPIKNLYQPKTIESTSICNSLKWCEEDDDFENLFKECSRLEEDVVNANMRILKKDEKQDQEKYLNQSSNTYSQTSICINIRRNLITRQKKLTNKNEKIPNSILKRKRLKDGQISSGKIPNKITQQKVVRFSKCYIKLIPQTSISKNEINF